MKKISPTIIDIICYLVWIYILTYVLFKFYLILTNYCTFTIVACWTNFENETPTLQKFVVCNAIGCESNLNTLTFIYSKKRNRLEHKYLNNVIFIQYNLKPQEM